MAPDATASGRSGDGDDGTVVQLRSVTVATGGLLGAPGEPRPGGIAGVGVEVVGDAAHHRVDAEGAVEAGGGHLGHRPSLFIVR